MKIVVDSLERKVLERYREGKISLRQGAEMLGVPYVQMNELLRAHQVPLASDPAEAFERAIARRRRA